MTTGERERLDETNRRELGDRAAVRAQRPGRVPGWQRTVAAADTRDAATRGLARLVRGRGEG